MNGWKVVFDEAAFEFFLGLKHRERHILMKAFATLNPIRMKGPTSTPQMKLIAL